ncbi:hypothetical protein PTSG_12352 [Salpingoeca rosetta]|uniref:Uncharacterized protein n=1 Tax=Salpingoeca rosetta (strain ATCC 50818 / BSB-021) TaxID=946362 RepID=F2UB17_SALR5|nr:uncharacterized protein PTSG_12352 [Salpingoeca rosetta]EGD74030.1 hypothetical protein PTSG_12352 [Salpingoeca rosetta]|eukprot:XP_004993592.1 hypothetical protein PTSG_12352 [Salpingoeca rosetta]
MDAAFGTAATALNQDTLNVSPSPLRPIASPVPSQQQTHQQRAHTLHFHNGNISNDCPVCGGRGRKSRHKVCGCCYSGVFNDINKYLRHNAHVVAQGSLTVDELAVGLKAMPRGCRNGYTCTQAAFSGPKETRCTRCRSVFACSAVPKFAHMLLRRAILNARKQAARMST